MTPLKRLVTPGFAALLTLGLTITSAGMAAARDIALIIGDRGQSSFFSGWSGVGTDGFEDALQDAGFEVIEPRDRDADTLQDAAHKVQTILADDKVERLLIVVTGPFAGNGRDNWALSNDATGASSLTVGGVGLSINGLSDLAAKAGKGVLLLDPGKEPRALGPGLRPGLGAVTPVGRVTYVIGDADKLLVVLQEGLLNPIKSYAEIAGSLPPGVQMTGFVAPGEGFLGQVGELAPEVHEENGYWRAVREIDMIDGYRRYLNAYPNGQYHSQARTRISYLKEAPEREARAAEAALNLSRATRRDIQKGLKLLGFDPRGIDGVFGAGSRRAIAKWQRTNGFEDTGYISGNQLFRLRDQVSAKQAEIAAAQQAEAEQERRRDRAYWRATGRKGTEQGLRAYLARYPNGIHADTARLELAAINDAARAEQEAEDRAAWATAQAGDTPDHYRAYLDAYPDGLFARDAKRWLDDIVQPGPSASEIARAQAEERHVAGNLVARLLIEQRLAAAGYNPGSIDGKFSSRARAAIGHFQTDRGLPATGYVSDATMRRLLRGD